MNSILQKLAGFSAKDWLLVVLVGVVTVDILPKIVGRILKRLANQGEALDAPSEPQYLGKVVPGSEFTQYSIAYGIEDADGRKYTGRRLARHTRVAKRAEFMLRLLVSALTSVNKVIDSRDVINVNQAHHLICCLAQLMIDHFARNGVALSISLIVGKNSASLSPMSMSDDADAGADE
ncbi:hypothetical protein IKF73_00950 [Candidatus Saccharibacteria bacterium]|nr:hypothetical protein [Candidatus Saccharibacteria bacterium]